MMPAAEDRVNPGHGLSGALQERACSAVQPQSNCTKELKCWSAQEIKVRLGAWQ